MGFFSRSALLQCAPTDRTSICCGGIHMCRTRSTLATPVINQVEIPSCSFSFLHVVHVFKVNLLQLGYLNISVADSSRAPPPPLLCALCYGPAASIRKWCLFHLPFGCMFRYPFVADRAWLDAMQCICARRLQNELRACISPTGSFVYIRIPSPSVAASHLPIKLPRTQPKRFLYLYTPREPDALHYSHFASVRPFIRLPVCSVICDRILACRRYCKKKTLIFACASINVSLVIVVLLLDQGCYASCFLFLLPAIGSRKWCACCSCSAATILGHIAIGSWCRLFVFVPRWIPRNGVLVVLFLCCAHGHVLCDMIAIGPRR